MLLMFVRNGGKWTMMVPTRYSGRIFDLQAAFHRSLYSEEAVIHEADEIVQRGP